MKISIDDEVLVMHLTVSQVKALIQSALQEATSTIKKQKEILSIEEVSELTGYKKATIYKLTHERKIPFHKPAHGGRRIFFKKEEISQWLQSNHIETYEESFENQKKDKIVYNKIKSEHGSIR
ncbi:MAG: helix-turn-helix domain-containing protein [Parabacteroides sp.]|nr:helix-turn-helix domain-containing protein [Parabacteroides sp.]